MSIKKKIIWMDQKLIFVKFRKKKVKQSIEEKEEKELLIVIN